ncbi:MAG TPA: lysylphosphatidylglycerol synthase transmembrane domain-containing protein [Candidatus Glassbacteria bacterium]|nr:lysylphosphatidylglycerol synthase transmembrane domain-containing protein [Candidatus Glassbacteria bacterium]
MIQTLKFALATVVVVYLILRGDIAWEPLWASLGQWRYSLPAVLLLALTPLGQLWRWQSLLRASHLRLPHREVFSYLMVSKFFNMAFPGYLSGDLIRGFYVSRRASAEAAAGPETASADPYARPSTVAASIVFDRVAGLLTLFTFCLLGLLGSIRQPLPSPLATSVGTLAGLGLLAPLLLFLLAYRYPLPPSFLLPVCRRIRLDQPFLALYQGLHHYARDLKLIRNILGISFLNQGLTIVTFILFGLALGIPVTLISYWVLVPLGLMMIAVPITPAGFGVGQVVFLALFHLVGTSQGANLFTLYMASYGLINLSGVFLFPLSRIRGGPLARPPYARSELDSGSNS